MQPLHQFMPAALAHILRRAPLCDEKVQFAWRSAVGPAVDRVSVVQLRDGVLHVQTPSVAWQREIERSAGFVRARLDALLGAGVVRWMEVAVGSAARPAARDSR
jgi:hypothetical protein